MYISVLFLDVRSNNPSNNEKTDYFVDAGPYVALRAFNTVHARPVPQWRSCPNT